MSDIEIEIDGKTCQAKPDAMVIQVADEAGIYIPRFCYHKHLSVAANCRMCLVEVEKSPKTLPACATPVTPGMKVFTRSPKALAAQKAVMEFLLINHPLDCPICDQGGECELQDLAMGYGSADSYYSFGKRAIKDQDIGPLIATDMTRCIQCTRCVRFGSEVAGMRELGVLNRGEELAISTYVEHAMKSEVSGNVIDICPVGALTSKPFRFTARAWELQQRPTISPHDCIGSNLYAHTRNGLVMRMVPHENTMINETWIADRDRYSYEGLYHADRISKPLIKKNNKWVETDWQTALEYAAQGLQKVLAVDADQLGVLASPNATLEEFYLLQKLARGLGCHHIDHRLQQVDFSDQDHLGLFPGLGMSVADVEQCDVICLIGSNIQKEQPSAALRVRKAFLKGAKIMAVNSLDYAFHFDLTEKQIVAPDEISLMLAGIAKALMASSKTKIPAALKSALAAVEANDISIAMAKQLQAGKKTCLLLGNTAFHSADAALIRRLSRLIAEWSGAHLGLLTMGANAAGAWLAGAVPHRGVAASAVKKPGLNAKTMIQDPRKAYLLLNVEPDLDCANPVATTEALQQAEFVVSLSLFRNAVLDQTADVILPIAAFTETAGTFVNTSGVWQSFKGLANAYEEARPAWKILRVLGNLLHLENFDYASQEDVFNEVKTAIDQMAPQGSLVEITLDEKQLKTESKGFVRIGDIPLYAVDSLVRRAKALQTAQPILEGNVAEVRLHPKTALDLRLEEGTMVLVKQKQGEVRLPLSLDKRLPLRGVWVAGGIYESRGLSELFGPIEIQKI